MSLVKRCVRKCLENRDFTYDNRDLRIGTIYPHFILEHLTEDMKYYDEMYCISKIMNNEISFIECPIQTDAMCRAILEKHPEYIRHVRDQSIEIVMYAIRKKASVVQYVRNQTKEIKMRTVAKSGMALQYIREQDEDICRVAVTRSGMALQFVQPEFKTLELCKLAVSRTQKALIYVSDEHMSKCKNL